ncbi:spore wall protein 2-like [Thunnus albacares]|uniref:spore wall protein 2-like n=1 Tax=Thunnus albacares TaxID=8236 RepID=UPI001CF6EF2E|nr:spore wall protein 2-like [Thunnus albacares]
MIGDDITLPCHVKPSTDAFNEMLEWSRPDLNPRFVHVRRAGEDYLPDQNPSYRGRTSVSINSLKQGDVSLKLSKVKLSDEGTYRCFIPGLKTESSVQLVVDSSSLSPSSVIGVIVGIIFILAVVFLLWKWRQKKLKTTKYHDDEETLKARDKKSNSTSNDPEQKFLIVRETDREKHTAEEETMKNQDLKIYSLSEESGLTHHEQPVTENKTNNVLVQKEGEIEIQSVNAGTGQMEDVRQQDEVQTVGQTERRVMSEANEVSCPAEEEGQQDKNKDKNNEEQNTTPIQDDTKPQPPIDGQKDQLPAVQSNVDKKDEDKETKSGNTGIEDQGPKDGERQMEGERGEDEEDETQSTNNETAGQGPTGGERQREDQQAGGETKDNLDQTRREENEVSCPAEEDGQQDKNRYRRDDVENTTPEKDDTISQPPVSGQTNQPQAGKTELDEKDEKEKPKLKDNKTTDQVPTVVETEQNAQQEGRETNNNFEQTGNEEKKASCPAKKEGQQDKNKDGRDGEENTKPQSPADGQTSLLPTGKVQGDMGKKDKGKKTKSAKKKKKNQGLKDGERQKEDKKGEENEEGKMLSDKGPTGGGKQKDALQARTKTNNHLDQTRSAENEVSYPAVEGGQQDNNKDGKDGEKKTTPIQDNTKPQPPINGQTDQISAEDVKSNEENKEKMEQTGLPGQTEGETHGEQPEKNQKGDRGGRTQSTSTKPTAAKSARSKKRRRRK